MTFCAAGCVIPSRHLAEHDEGDTCTGCLPARVATGLLVCPRCESRSRDALSGLGSLWVEVETSGTLKGRQTGARGQERPLPIDTAAAEWRTALRTCLVGWCKVLEEDFGATLDGAQDTVAWMADKVAIYAGRLLASEHADQLVSDLLGSVDEDGKRHGDLWGEGKRLAFRSSSGRGLSIQCPSCPERVRFNPDAEWIQCHCGEAGVPSWWVDRLVGSMETMPAPRVIEYLRTEHRVTLTEVTLRQWVARGKVVTQGRDEMGRSMYDAVSVAVVAIQRREMSA